MSDLTQHEGDQGDSGDFDSEAAESVTLAETPVSTYPYIGYGCFVSHKRESSNSRLRTRIGAGHSSDTFGDLEVQVPLVPLLPLRPSRSPVELTLAGPRVDGGGR